MVGMFGFRVHDFRSNLAPAKNDRLEQASAATSCPKAPFKRLRVRTLRVRARGDQVAVRPLAVCSTVTGRTARPCPPTRNSDPEFRNLVLRFRLELGLLGRNLVLVFGFPQSKRTAQKRVPNLHREH